MYKEAALWAALIGAMMTAHPALAAVSTEAAARLGDGTLTPMGAEMAGNADGSIPP